MLEKLPDAVGHALRDARAGLENIAYNLIDLRAGTAALTVSSMAFHDHESIPERYTADGKGSSPPLQWTGIPAGAGSLIVMVEDADAPMPNPLVHAIACGIAPIDGALAEGALEDEEHAPEGVVIGRNSFLLTGWLPPDPPPGHGLHRYAFQVFALMPGADLSGTPGRDAVLQAIAQFGIGSGCLIGTYERPDTTITEGIGNTANAGGRVDMTAA